MASSSWRSLIDSYYRGRLCFICLQLHDESSKKPSFRCSLCQTSFHHSCHEAAFGSDSDSRCCSPAIEGRIGIKCKFCKRKSGLLADQEGTVTYHLECIFNDRFISNKRISQDARSKSCSACGSSSGQLFQCGHAESFLCNQAFHLVCHQNLLLSLPLTLERLVHGPSITLHCCLHQSEERRHLMAFHSAYKRRVSQNLEFEVYLSSYQARDVFRVEDQTISQIAEEHFKNGDNSLQEFLLAFESHPVPTRKHDAPKLASVSLIRDEAEEIGRSDHSKHLGQGESPAPMNVLEPLGSPPPGSRNHKLALETMDLSVIISHDRVQEFTSFWGVHPSSHMNTEVDEKKLYKNNYKDQDLQGPLLTFITPPMTSKAREATARLLTKTLTTLDFLVFSRPQNSHLRT